ncbi:MAG: hypothetical protein ACJAXJ_000042 [Colwellia sp.]|jgi:hypothetical protein
MKKITFNIASGNSQGLTNDAIILTNVLTELYGGNVNIRHFSGSDTKLTNIKKLLSLIINKYLFQQKQITFHLEEIYTEISPFSNQNILIPNQEWLRTGTQKAIKPETHIWCKTHYAVKQLKHLNDNVEYLGFCSRNLLDESITPNFNAFIHIAGKSEQKGTIAILNVWQKHPEWPLLKVISRREEHLEYQAENIEFITEFLTECQLKSLINQCGVHLCPSESEGFGHNIVEAMSANSIVVTTNAPPMNELIHPDEICLVNYNKTDKRYFSELFFIDKSHFEVKITQLIAMKELDKINIFKQNQSKFDKLKVQFVKQLQSKLNNWNL